MGIFLQFQDLFICFSAVHHSFPKIIFYSKCPSYLTPTRLSVMRTFVWRSKWNQTITNEKSTGTVEIIFSVPVQPAILKLHRK